MLYWLSVLDGIQNGFFVGFFTVSMACAIASVIRLAILCTEHRGHDGEAFLQIVTWERLLKGWFIVALFGMGAMLTPSTDSLIKAWFMLEGAQVVTSENAEEAAEELSNKLDKLIEAVRSRE